MKCWRLFALVLAVGAGLVGCTQLAADAPSRVWYVLEDAGGARMTPPEPAREIRVSGEPGSDFYESRALAFSRERATRGYFQYASWSESPADRIARLFRARLREGGAAAPPGARALRLVLDDLYLDVADAGKPMVRLVIEARLEPGLANEAGAAQVFRIDEAVANADAAGMAQGAGRALGRVFDDILEWLDRTMVKPAARRG
ncbi:MAG: ABC-type transport auxiliary lipoprotein family protein [Burkholderiaceae bacterium]